MFLLFDMQTNMGNGLRQVLADHGARDAQLFKDAHDRLQKASYKMAEQMYKQAGAGQGQAAPPPGGDTGASQDSTQAQKDVIDAEFEERN